jgi:4-amino-4-deoxy-L-arabinose transferase-like glycosyltransferase
MYEAVSKLITWPRIRVHLSTIILIAVLSASAWLLLHNLRYSPRPWHDEGLTLALAKTLVEDGMYGVRSSDGYQTFGAIQSVGPTVILPLALSFKLWGVGLIQARMLMAVYALLVLILVYLAGRELFGTHTATVALLLVLGAPAVAFLHYGRQALGEVPAVGYFLAGWLVWTRAVRSNRRMLYLLAGLLLGLAMVTKSQFVPIGFGTIAILIVLDRFYYRQGNIRALLLVGAIAAACVAAWLGWQFAYFGRDLFQENANKLRQLAASTMGFDLRLTIAALQYLLGQGSDHYYGFLGFPALAYAAVLCMRRHQDGFVLAFLVIFTGLWLAYFMFWIIPWPHYSLAPLLISALFVAKLCHDVTQGFRLSWASLKAEVFQGRPAKATLTLVALLAIFLLVSDPLQHTIRIDVFGEDRGSEQTAAFLEQQIDKGAIIETWERELAIYTNHNFHFPDQSLLIKTHAAYYRNGPRNYVLSDDYFGRFQPNYLVLGPYGRSSEIYDMHFLAANSCLITTVRSAETIYEIFKLNATFAPANATGSSQVAGCAQ